MKKHILIIDDEKDFCLMIKRFLEEKGDFEVTICTDGEDGFRRVKAQKPDLILLDIFMPKKDGATVAAELKADKETQKIPFIFLTAMIKENEAKNSGSFIGGEYFIAKPVKVDSLLAMINKLV